MTGETEKGIEWAGKDGRFSGGVLVTSIALGQVEPVGARGADEEGEEEGGELLFLLVVTSGAAVRGMGGPALVADAGGVRADAVIGAVGEGNASSGCYWRVQENAACAGRE